MKEHLTTLLINRAAGVFFAMCLSCAAVCGQEMEAAQSLNLTGTSVPANAHRVLREYVPAEIDGALEKIVAASGGKLRRGETEMLLWTGRELKQAGSAAIAGRLIDTLKSVGWRYEIGGVENDVTFFSLLKDGATPRALIGLFGEADGTFIFALTELRATEPATSGTSVSNGENYAGGAGAYSFTTPPGWSRSAAGGKIVLSKGGENRIEFLPLVSSSGDLERDAERIIWQVFKGCDAWYANGFTADWGTFEKGRTAQGLEYYRVYRYAKSVGDENSGLAQSKFDAILLLVKTGDRVAVIAGRQPFQTDYSRDTTLTALDFILYDLAIEGASGAYDLKNELLGSWSAAGGSVGLAYTFNANGTFHKGGATEFRTRIDQRTQEVRSTSFGMTQSYSLTGNILTQNYRPTGEVVKSKVRVYYTKYDKDAWQHKIGLLPLGNGDGGSLVLRRN